MNYSEIIADPRRHLYVPGVEDEVVLTAPLLVGGYDNGIPLGLPPGTVCVVRRRRMLAGPQGIQFQLELKDGSATFFVDETDLMPDGAYPMAPLTRRLASVAVMGAPGGRGR